MTDTSETAKSSISPEDTGSGNAVGGQFSVEAKKARDAFFAHKQATKGQPQEPPTPLQRRMQSGGSGI